MAKDGRLLGMGSGQPNRVNSVRIALEKAADNVQVQLLSGRAQFPSHIAANVLLFCARMHPFCH